jgi:hypothetical protein
MHRWTVGTITCASLLYVVIISSSSCYAHSDSVVAVAAAAASRVALVRESSESAAVIASPTANKRDKDKKKKKKKKKREQNSAKAKATATPAPVKPPQTPPLPTPPGQPNPSGTTRKAHTLYRGAAKAVGELDKIATGAEKSKVNMFGGTDIFPEPVKPHVSPPAVGAAKSIAELPATGIDTSNPNFKNAMTTTSNPNLPKSAATTTTGLPKNGIDPNSAEFKTFLKNNPTSAAAAAPKPAHIPTSRIPTAGNIAKNKRVDWFASKWNNAKTKIANAVTKAPGGATALKYGKKGLKLFQKAATPIAVAVGISDGVNAGMESDHTSTAGKAVEGAYVGATSALSTNLPVIAIPDMAAPEGGSAKEVVRLAGKTMSHASAAASQATYNAARDWTGMGGNPTQLERNNVDVHMHKVGQHIDKYYENINKKKSVSHPIADVTTGVPKAAADLVNGKFKQFGKAVLNGITYTPRKAVDYYRHYSAPLRNMYHKWKSPVLNP